MQPTHRYLAIDRRNDVFCVRFRNRRLDEEELATMTDELFALIRVEGCRKMALSLGPEPPQFLYSVFLARLVSVQRLLREHEGSLVLCELRPEVYRIFEACRLDTQFHFTRTVEEACVFLEKSSEAPADERDTMTESSATFVACLTPPGQGAIATLGLAGPTAWGLVRPLFQPLSPNLLPDKPAAGQSWLGRCGDEFTDQVVLAVKTDTLEIHCHGGRTVVQWLLDLFVARGARLCSWQDFQRRTSSDAIRAEAAVALAQATTTRTAAILLDQYNGALTTTISAIVAALRDCAISPSPLKSGERGWGEGAESVAAQPPHPRPLSPDYRGEGRQLGQALNRGATTAARSLLGELTRWTRLGRRLTEPWKVAVIGAPNVGKSSLVNALAGYQRSVVSPTPGTTRDVVTSTIAIAGWPVELSDTAGLRDDSGLLEQQGIARARMTAENADLCLWVVDASTPPVWPETATKELRIVVNKVDLPPAWNLAEAGDAVRVSATTGQGLERLCTALSRWLMPHVPPAGAAVPFTPRLCAAIEAAQRSLERGAVDEARQGLAALADHYSQATPI